MGSISYDDSLKMISPLSGESPIPYEEEKELIYLRYKSVVDTLIGNGIIKEAVRPFVLTRIREELGLHVEGILSVPKSLDNITL